jgi:hypothetical protein
MARGFIFPSAVSRSAFTSSDVSSRSLPGSTSSSSGPYPTRRIFSAKCPIAANIFLSSRFRPSVSTTSYHGFSPTRTCLIRAGAVRTRSDPASPRSIATPLRSRSSSSSLGCPATFTR